MEVPRKMNALNMIFSMLPLPEGGGAEGALYWPHQVGHVGQQVVTAKFSQAH